MVGRAASGAPARIRLDLSFDCHSTCFSLLGLTFEKGWRALQAVSSAGCLVV